MKIQTLRLFNEDSQILGLTSFDLVGLGYTLVLSYKILENINLELISFILIVFLGLALIHLRMTYRKKIIRDTILFYLMPKNINSLRIIK